MLTVGIDIGYEGAIAAIRNCEDEIIMLEDTPLSKPGQYDVQRMRELVLRLAVGSLFPGESLSVFIETPQARTGPFRSEKNAIKRGIGFGLWYGIFASTGTPQPVDAQTWTHRMFHGMEGTNDDKQKSMIKAAELFPSAELYTARGRALDGRADALLIARWGYEFLMHQQEKTND